ncbi:MAG: NADH dehydrogenase ubiquinone Fe-S protein 4 [Alphaproteobacteria bacterium]
MTGNADRIEPTNYGAENRISNDNRRAPLAMGRSAFPKDAVAHIYKPSRSVMTSGKARTKAWRLAFERRTAPVAEPLMGWIAGDDTLAQVEVEFSTLQSAIRYAERQGLAYVIHGKPGSVNKSYPPALERIHAASDTILQKLGLKMLQESYGRAIDEFANLNTPLRPEDSPMDVACDRDLPLDARRSILINWAQAEYQVDREANKKTQANGEASRLGEIEQAIMALEGSGVTQVQSEVA